MFTTYFDRAGRRQQEHIRAFMPNHLVLLKIDVGAPPSRLLRHY